MTTTTETVCETCNGNLWVENAGVDPRPCGDCNAGNWDGPLPYPGWPGPCREFACDDAVHPCALFHDPMSCDRPPANGCGCDLEAHEANPESVAVPAADEPSPYPEIPWCENDFCRDRLHVDGVHLDEHGRPFRGTTPDPAEWPDAEPDQALDDELDDEPGTEWPADVVTAAPPQPRPVSLTPIYDQLVDEHNNRERA